MSSTDAAEADRVLTFSVGFGLSIFSVLTSSSLSLFVVGFRCCCCLGFFSSYFSFEKMNGGRTSCMHGDDDNQNDNNDDD